MSQVIQLPVTSLPPAVEPPDRNKLAVNGPTVQLIRRERFGRVDFMPKNPYARHFANIAGRHDSSLTLAQVREINLLGFVIEVDGVRV